METNFEQLLEKLSEKVKGMANTDTIVGEEFTLGEFRCKPVIKVGLGFGAGVGEGEDPKIKQKGKGNGAGAGIGNRDSDEVQIETGYQLAVHVARGYQTADQDKAHDQVCRDRAVSRPFR
ncbi:MAG: GerW family sporulation protein [Bacteroidota bacterium]